MKQACTKGFELFFKVTFKGNIFNLGNNIVSYQQLVKSAMNRFPQLKKIFFFFQQQIVTEQNFKKIIECQLVQEKKSIKLQLKESPDQKQVQKFSLKSKKYSFNPHQFGRESKKYSFDLNDFDEEGEDSRKKSLQEEFQVLGLSQKQLKDKENFIDPTKINIKVLISKQFESIETKLNDEYFWKCSFVNQSGFDINDEIFIKQFSTQDVIEVKNLKNLENRQIVFGPYSEKQLGKHLHFYQIVYKKNEKQFVPICNKFGFISETKKSLIVKEIQNKVVQRVNKIKSFCVCQKTTQYIVKAMKQLNITDQTIEGFKDEDIIDLIESLNAH